MDSLPRVCPVRSRSTFWLAKILADGNIRPGQANLRLLARTERLDLQAQPGNPTFLGVHNVAKEQHWVESLNRTGVTSHQALLRGVVLAVDSGADADLPFCLQERQFWVLTSALGML